MNQMIEKLRVFRVTTRRAATLAEKIVRQGLTFGSGKRPLRSLRVIESEKNGGSDYFIGLRLSELEYQELVFSAESDHINSLR